jgi:serine protease
MRITRSWGQPNSHRIYKIKEAKGLWWILEDPSALPNEIFIKTFKGRKTRMRMIKKLLPIGITTIVMASMLAAISGPASAEIINVPDDYSTIQAAINAASDSGGGTVLVAAGTYKESIVMKSGVTIQGSGADVTIIDGGGLSFTVKGASDSTISGFTITGGGDGISNQSSSPTITNNIIIGNKWDGIYNQSSSPTITNNIIIGNKWVGIHNYWYSSPTITNNTISGNIKEGIHNEYSSPIITNNIITNNLYGINNWPLTPTISYNNVWDNITKNYVGILPDPTGTDGNISVNPMFVDPSNGDYHLQTDSPCIDAGDPDSENFLDFPDTDLDGNPRIIDGDSIVGAVVDMGAFEYLSNSPPEADAGEEQRTVEQESYEGAEVTLDGSGSTDPDSTTGTNDDIVSFDWYEGESFLGSGETLNHAFPLGEHTVTLVVTDSAGETDEDEVIIVVQDTTPPNVKIEYPSDGARVFMDEEIDVIYDVSDIRDPDLAVTVTPEDPISPPLPIGELTITVTATDAYGNEGSDSVTVEVLGPAGIKEDAVTQLEAVKTSSRRVDRVINKVIGLIAKSLGDKYWVDDLYLDAKRGGMVFIYEGLAVGYMKLHIKLWDKRGPTPEQQKAIDAFEEVIPKLVKADKVLAETAIDEANDAQDPWNPGKLRAYNRFLAKADRAFDKALHLADNDRPKRAIRSFKQAWKNAQQAMKMAQ